MLMLSRDDRHWMPAFAGIAKKSESLKGLLMYLTRFHIGVNCIGRGCHIHFMI